MKSIYLSLIAALTALTVQGCNSMEKNLPPQPTVERVEIPRFMGKWYVIANIPTSPEKGAFNATEAYTWNAEKETIDVEFKFNKDGFDGKEKSIPQTAWIHNQTTKAEWRVRPIWPLKFAYLIVDLAPDYTDTIVGVPDRSHVWIMSREPHMKESRYNELVSKVKNFGYDISKLERVPQQPKKQNTH